MPQDGIFGEIKIHATDVEVETPEQIRLDISYPTSLKIAVAERFQVKDLGREWADAGVYLLLERPSQDGTWSAYVGKSAARGGVKGRLRLHLRDLDKSSWYRAIAVCPADGGWDEAEVAFLEGHVYRALSELPGISLSNGQVPSSGRLAQNRRMRLLGVPEVLVGVLTLIGHSQTGQDFQQAPRSEASQSSGTERPSRLGKLVGLVEEELLGAGTKLVPLDPRWLAHGIVTASGCIEVAREIYWSPSGAARAVSGRIAESGWTFWAVESPEGPTLHELRDLLASRSMAPPNLDSDQDSPSDHSQEDEKQPKNEPSGNINRETQRAGAPSVSASQVRGIQLSDLVAAGIVPVGATLVSTSRKWPSEARILEDGQIEIEGDAFESLSAAGTAATRGTSVNGWNFWALGSPEGERLAEARERFVRGN